MPRPAHLIATTLAVLGLLAGPSAAQARSHRIAGSASGQVTGVTFTLHLRDGTLGRGQGTLRFTSVTRVHGNLRLSHGTMRIRAVLLLSGLPATKRPSAARMALRASVRITGGTRRYRRARGSFLALGTLNAYTGRFTVRLNGSYRG